MTTEQINKAAKEYAERHSSVMHELLSVRDFTAGANFTLSHSRQEIEELKAENAKLREALKNCLDELLYESATGAIYLQVRTVQPLAPERILTARKLIEG